MKNKKIQSLKSFYNFKKMEITKKPLIMSFTQNNQTISKEVYLKLKHGKFYTLCE